MDTRKTKIVCTVGPACREPANLDKMVAAGMNVARLNMSHASHEEHMENARNIRAAAEKAGKTVAVLLDVRGPKIRTGVLPGGMVKLVDNSCVTLVSNCKEAPDGKIPVDYPTFSKHVKKGDKIFIDDGILELGVDSVKGDEMECTVIVGGVLKDRKGITVPGAMFTDLPSITDKDKEDLKLAARINVDFLAQSFVRNGNDVKEMKQLLKAAGCNAQVIAKIEDAQAVKHLDEIIAEADGIMVARGDLGVQIPFEDVPTVQKTLVAKCRAANKPVIVATQMLESMIRIPQPTRAEVSDVANAILDGADAVMLSAETASGTYPIRAVQAMARIIQKTEEKLFKFNQVDASGENLAIPHAIGKSVVYTARDLNAKAIVAYTSEGHTARYISSSRPGTGIIAATPNKDELGKLQLLWGVRPLLVAKCKHHDEAVTKSIEAAVAHKMLSKGDVAVVAAGVPLETPGNMNTMQVVLVA